VDADVYQGAPTPVTMFLSVGSKAAGFAIILRIFYTALTTGPVGQRLPDLSFEWSYIFAVLAVLTMTVGNLAALGQTNVKRMLGYSSIAQAGYVLVGLATVGVYGVAGVLFFIAGYIATNLGAFIAVIAISNQIDSDEIEDYRGLSRRAPLLAAALTFCLISLVGIPPTAGFVGKFYLFSAAIDYGLVWLVLIAVVNTALSAYYYVKLVRAMYFADPATELAIRPSLPTGIALGLASLTVLLIGILPSPLFTITSRAAETLLLR
jgi:NADH-quinone oxidoreductase subunit N